MFKAMREVAVDAMVVRFALTALVVVGVVGVLLGIQLTDQLRSSHLDGAHGRALVTGRMLQHEAMMAQETGAGGRERADSSDLRARFERHLGPAGIPEAHVWSPDGTLLFETGDVHEEGMREPAKAARVRAVLESGEPSSAIVGIGRDDAHHELTGEAFVTYLPMTFADGSRPDAVLELAQDYAPTAAAIGAALRRLAVTLVGGLVGLYLLLLPIVAGASRRLRRLVADQDEHVRRLEEAEQVKNTFLEAVSHEMRTPLTAISGMLSLLDRHGTRFPADQRERMVARAYANATRLENLLEDLLDVDRLTRGVITARRSPLDLDRVVVQTVDALDLESHPLELDIEPCRMHADAAHVERIVENLLVNAVKYTPPGTPIWVRVQPTEDGALLVVEDAGPGVPEGARERIFEPFERAHEMDHAPGTGVGLALVRRFARMHDGEAWVEDRPGGGASFKVRLRDPDPPQRSAASSAPPADDRSRPRPRSTRRPRRFPDGPPRQSPLQAT